MDLGFDLRQRVGGEIRHPHPSGDEVYHDIAAENDCSTAYPMPGATAGDRFGPSPPSIPSRPFNVFSASFSPPGMEMVIVAPGFLLAVPNFLKRLSMTSCIMARGPGLMAGSPTPSASPGRVTVRTLDTVALN